MATTQSIQINCYINKPNSVNGKFAPIETIVYKMPTIDECMALLPRDIGNHILSFTNAWLEWYLENIRNKYGDKFIVEMLILMLRNKFHIYFSNKKRNYNNPNILINYILKNMGNKFENWMGNPIQLTRDSIRFAFEDQMVILSARKALSQQRLLQKKQEYNVWFNTLQVGDIVDADKLVVKKTNTSYRYFKIHRQFQQSNAYWLIKIEDKHIRIGRTDLHISLRKPIKIKVGETIIDFDDENPIQQIKTL
jgi:hypothetical protein